MCDVFCVEVHTLTHRDTQRVRENMMCHHGMHMSVSFGCLYAYDARIHRSSSALNKKAAVAMFGAGQSPDHTPMRTHAKCMCLLWWWWCEYGYST